LEVLGIIGKFDFILSKIADLVDILTKNLEKEEQCYKIVHKSHISDVKAEKDSARDTLVVGIKHMIKAGLRHFDASVREAAQLLKIVFDTYDKPISLTDLPYDAETRAIINLLRELDSKYVREMEIVGITPWVAELQVRNDEFDTFVKNYNIESSEKPTFHAADVRKESDRAYRDIITFINSLIVVDKETSYDQFVSELNTLIKHYDDLYARHIGQVGGGEKQDDED
jgi:hypothetical protein